MRRRKKAAEVEGKEPEATEGNLLDTLEAEGDDEDA